MIAPAKVYEYFKIYIIVCHVFLGMTISEENMSVIITRILVIGSLLAILVFSKKPNKVLKEMDILGYYGLLIAPVIIATLTIKLLHTSEVHIIINHSSYLLLNIILFLFSVVSRLKKSFISRNKRN